VGSHQQVTCSGLVYAAKAVSGDTATFRVRRIVFEARSTTSPAPRFRKDEFGISVRLRCQRFEVSLKIVEPPFPLAAEWFEPIGEIFHGKWRQSTRPLLALACCLDEARLLQDPEVLRYRWLGQVKRVHQFRYCRRSIGQAEENGPTGRIAQGEEGLVQVL
jgi:hypothetical protein